MNPYDFAIQMSLDGEKFFRALIKQVKRPGLRKILVVLAEDQAIHRRNIEKMKKAAGPTPPDARNLEGALNPFAQRLRSGRAERVDENLPAAELYRRGQELDKACEDFYRKRAAGAKDLRLKQAFLELAEEQRKHHFSLEHLINFLLEPQQTLEDAEWHVAEPPDMTFTDLQIDSGSGRAQPAEARSKTSQRKRR
ncbi:MAG: ferritin family protein [bacterium]